MTRNRHMHEYIRARVKAALSGRTLKWLADESKVPQSTLSVQMLKPKFSLDVLARISRALGEDIVYFLPEELGRSRSSNWILTELDSDLEALRCRYSALGRARARTDPENGNPLRESDSRGGLAGEDDTRYQE